MCDFHKTSSTLNQMLRQYESMIRLGKSGYDSVGDMIMSEYYGNNHLMMHHILAEAIDTYDISNHSDQVIMSNLASLIEVESPKDLELILRLLAKLMLIVQWDGEGAISNADGSINDVRYTYVRNGICHVLLRITSAPRYAMENLENHICGEDRQLMKAAFLLLSSWLFGGLPPRTNLDGFMQSTLLSLSNSEDNFIKNRTKRIMEGIAHCLKTR